MPTHMESRWAVLVTSITGSAICTELIEILAVVLSQVTDSY